MKIGSRIRTIRTRGGITLKELAKRTGLTQSFLSQLERDLTSPSVNSLEKIANALHTKIGYFFEQEEGKKLVFVRKGMGKSLDKGKNIACETLVSGILNISMKPQGFTLKPGVVLKEELLLPQGEKFGMVLKGQLEFECGEGTFVFEEGDSIYCADISEPKKVTNVGVDEAKLLWIVFAPA